jgi:hypothetical protein
MDVTMAPAPGTTTPPHTPPPPCKITHPHPKGRPSVCLAKIPNAVTIRPADLTEWELDLLAWGDHPVTEWEMVDRRRDAHGTVNPYQRLHGHHGGLRRNDLTALWSAFVITANRAL